MMRDEPFLAFRGSVAAILAGLVVGTVCAQPPIDDPGSTQVCQRRGHIHRMFHHTAHTLHDKFIGSPENFIEPPLGTYVREQLSIQTAKADTHRFTLYKSDFLPGTSRFSPTGAARFNLMYSRIQGWLGPVTVEWTPDEPGLAEARKQVVLATLEKAGKPVLPERVLIGPSPYPGAFGTEAGTNFNTMIFRSQAAAQGYPLSPSAVAMGALSAGGQ